MPSGYASVGVTDLCMTNAKKTPTSPEARRPWRAGAGGGDARGQRQPAPRLLTGAAFLWATFCQRPRAVAGRSCPRSGKAMLRLGRPPRPTGKRRRRRLRLCRFARGGSAGALRNHHVGVASASHTDMLIPFDSDRNGVETGLSPSSSTLMMASDQPEGRQIVAQGMSPEKGRAPTGQAPSAAAEACETAVCRLRHRFLTPLKGLSWGGAAIPPLTPHSATLRAGVGYTPPPASGLAEPCLHAIRLWAYGHRAELIDIGVT